MPRNLRTGWIAIATSGPVPHGATDGRFVRKEWLEDMAEVYNARVFAAHIRPDHNDFWSGGTVAKLKVEPSRIPELKDEITLYAILSPGDELVRANANGYYTFPSIEVGENYRNTGKFFLQSLGAVDDPGASGIDEFKFSRADNASATFYPGAKFNIADALEVDDSIADRLKAIFSKPLTPPAQDDDTMTADQLANLQKTFSDAITAQSAAIATSMTAQFAAIKPAEPVAPIAPPAPVVPVDDGEKFAALTQQNADLVDANTALTEKFATLDTAQTELLAKFTALEKTPNPGTPDPAPGATEEFDGI